ncbi:MAG: hypothetical protein RR315_06140, partial [Oscillospiraceae bacterium]
MLKNEWLGIAYSIPATPSKNRVFIWRKLKSMGAQIIKPGMAALPYSAESLKIFKSLCKKIHEFDGEASLFEFNFIDPEETHALNEKFKTNDYENCKKMLLKCKQLISKNNVDDGKIEKKDFEQKLITTISQYKKLDKQSLTSQAKAEMENALSEILSAIKQMPTELKALLKK